MKRIKIEITATDIKRGKPLEADACPIARAMRRARVCKDPHVVGDYWTSGPDHFPADRYTLPKKAQAFIDRFDAGLKVKPFSFVVRL